MRRVLLALVVVAIATAVVMVVLRPSTSSGDATAPSGEPEVSPPARVGATIGVPRPVLPEPTRPVFEDNGRAIRLAHAPRAADESERDYEARRLIVEALERFIVDAKLDETQQRVLLVGMAALQEASRRAADVWKEEQNPTVHQLSKWLHQSKSALDVRLRDVLSPEQFGYWIQEGLDGSLVELLWFATPVEVTPL